MNSPSAKAFITFIFSLIATNVFSQTNKNKPKLNISVGYLYSELSEPKSYDPYVYYDYKTEAGNGYSISALVDFPHNNFEVSLGTSFFSTRNILTFNRRPSVDQGLWGYRKEVELNYLNFRILLKYHPLRWMNFQSGLGFSFPLNHQIRTLEVEAVRPDIPVPTSLTLNVWEDFESSDAMAINL
ncbi:hypothetical protein, partial [Fulvivirga sp.]|uniref:hypothetical protein n=1 Tax=Fulvivirga sp. TaxID=1931237 RepID=UPI0032EE655D